MVCTAGAYFVVFSWKDNFWIGSMCSIFHEMDSLMSVLITRSFEFCIWFMYLCTHETGIILLGYMKLRVLVVRDPYAVCRADARLSAQHFHHCDVIINLTYSSYYHHSF
jgi:hypothetical protein